VSPVVFIRVRAHRKPGFHRARPAIALLQAGVGKDSAGARERLAAVIAEAQQSHLVAIELDARLASLELRKRAAGVREATAERRLLIQDARVRGFGLIARKAMG
jgi:hypothetical protein